MVFPPTLSGSTRLEFSPRTPSDRLCERSREPGEGLLVSPVIDPAAAFFRPDEGGASQPAHVIRDRGLRQPDGLLDVAGAQARLAGREKLAAALPARSEQP